MVPRRRPALPSERRRPWAGRLAPLALGVALGLASELGPPPAEAAPPAGRAAAGKARSAPAPRPAARGADGKARGRRSAGPSSGSGPTPAARPPVQVAVEVHRERLAGGVELVVAPQPSSPVVVVAVVEGAGSAADPPGRAGLSALRARVGDAATAERRAALVAARGGTHDLLVGPDDVVSTTVLPPGELPLALWLEADRLSARPSEPALLSALRSMAEDRARAPFERHRDRLDALAFQGMTSYAHGADGTADELLAARDALLRGAASAASDRPVAVVIAGPVDPEAARAEARRHLAGVAASGQLGAPAGLPEQINQRAAEATDAGAGTPALAFAFAVAPEAVREDGDALDLAAALLATGPGSRLARALDDGSLDRAAAWLERRRGPSVFRVELHLTSTADPVAVRDRVERLLGELGKAPPRPEELARAAEALALRRAEALASPVELATSLGRRTLAGDAATSWEIGAHRAVDGAAVARAAASHLTPIRRNVLTIHPERPVAARPSAGPPSDRAAARPPSAPAGSGPPAPPSRRPEGKPSAGRPKKPDAAQARPKAPPAASPPRAGRAAKKKASP